MISSVSQPAPRAPSGPRAAERARPPGDRRPRGRPECRAAARAGCGTGDRALERGGLTEPFLSDGVKASLFIGWGQPFYRMGSFYRMGYRMGAFLSDGVKAREGGRRLLLLLLLRVGREEGREERGGGCNGTYTR